MILPTLPMGFKLRLKTMNAFRTAAAAAAAAAAIISVAEFAAAAIHNDGCSRNQFS